MKFFTYVLYSVYAAIIIGMGLLFFAPTIPGVGAIDVKIVKSGSMEPTIMTGGIVLVNEAPAYKEGDVVTFTSTDSSIPTTHRIVGTEVVDGEKMFITKGDANEERDASLVAKGDILGKVAFSLPFVGFILDFARQPLGFTLLVGVPAFLIIIDEITNIWREVRRMRRSKVGIDAISPLVVAPYRPPEPVVGRGVKEVISMADIQHTKYAEEQKQTRQELVRFMDIKPVVREVKAKTGARLAVATPPPARVHFDIRPKLTAAALVLALVGLGTNLPLVGSTISFSADVESSVQNILTADTLDFTVSPATSTINFVGGTAEGSNEVEVLVTPSLETGSDLVYKVSAEYVSGNSALCDNIVLDAGAPLPYNGDLLALTGEEVDLAPSWDLEFSMAENLVFPVDNVCVAGIVFEGWVDAPDGVGGYVDVETLLLTFVAETFSPATNLNALTGFSLDASGGDVAVEEIGEETVAEEGESEEVVPEEVEVVIEEEGGEEVKEGEGQGEDAGGEELPVTVAEEEGTSGEETEEAGDEKTEPEETVENVEGSEEEVTGEEVVEEEQQKEVEEDEGGEEEIEVENEEEIVAEEVADSGEGEV